jgi:hypothetical protein
MNSLSYNQISNEIVATCVNQGEFYCLEWSEISLKTLEPLNFLIFLSFIVIPILFWRLYVYLLK